MVLGKPVTAPFPRAPEGMAAGRPAASAAPSEARAPGSLPAPRHPDVVRDPSLRWVLRRLRACTPGLACRTGTERRRRTVAPAAPGASRRSGQTRAVPCPRGGGALFSVRGVAAQPGGTTAEKGQVLPVQPGDKEGQPRIIEKEIGGCPPPLFPPINEYLVGALSRGRCVKSYHGGHGEKGGRVHQRRSQRREEKPAGAARPGEIGAPASQACRSLYGAWEMRAHAVAY